MNEQRNTWARTFMDAVRIDVTRILLSAAWRTLPLRHPSWRGIFLAGQAIRYPREAEAEPAERILSHARFDQLMEEARANERARCADIADEMDCAMRCRVGHEVGDAIRGGELKKVSEWK